MQIGFECPSDILEEIQPLGDFDFVLAHLILKDEIYHDHYKKKSGHSTSRLLILDNSVNELGNPCGIEEMVEAAIEVSPNFIVPPDFLGDMKSTLHSLDDFIKVVGNELPGVRLLPVLQGSTSNECVTCSMNYQQRGFKQVAVPYDIICTKDKSLQYMASKRVEVIWRISEGYDWIHLLGMTDPNEFSKYKGLSCKLTLDTGSPILHGLHGIHLSETAKLFDKTKCSLDRMDHHKNDLAMVKENIEYLKELVGEIG